MSGRGEADALVWIAAFGGPRQPPVEIPTILLAPPPVPAAGSAAVFLPVGTPGLDHPGQIFRTDAIVALRLARQAAPGLPDAASVIERIERGLADAGAPN